jgi:membrane protein YdbS with pleckstrin-like domain
MTTEIKAKLTNLNTMYLASIDNAFLGGNTLMSDTTFPGTGASLNNTLYSPANLGPLYVNRIFANDTATSSPYDTYKYTASGSSTPAISLSTTPQVIVFNVDSKTAVIQSPTYVNYPLTGSEGDVTASGFNVTSSGNGTGFTTDINCMDLLLPRISPTNIPASFFILQGLYAWYSLLDSVNWKQYSSGQQVTITVPDIASTIPTTPSTTSGVITYNSSVTIPASTDTTTLPTQLNSQMAIPQTVTSDLGNNIKTLMNNIIPFTIFYPVQTPNSNFNPFVARRLVHLYILLFNFNIASTYRSGSTILQNSIYELLSALNKNVTDVNNGAFTNIMTAVNTRLNTYNSNITQITKLNDDVTQLTDKLSTDKSNLNTRLQFQNTFKKYRTIAFVMLLIIATGSLVLFTFPMEYKKKLAGGGLLVIISVVSAFILQYQYNKTLSRESFTTNPMISSIARRSLNASATAFDQLIDETSKYLDNTLLLTTTLDSYHLYGNVNQSLLRENSFLYDSTLNLQQKDYNMKDMYNITYVNQVRFSSLMNLAISLSLIIAVTISISLAVEGYPEVRKYVLGLGILLSVIAIVIYILEVTSRVHTDPKQIYWGGSVKKLQ